MIIPNATVRVINPVMTGESKATGLPYKNQEIVISMSEALTDGRERELMILGTLHGNEVDKFQQLNPQVGMTIHVDVVFRTRSYNNRIYNDTKFYICNYE